MADQELEILIKTIVDEHGAVAAREALDNVTGATKRGTDINREATGVIDKLKGGHRELHKAMRLVTEQSPLLGLALRAALNPIGAAITAAILVFKHFHDQIKETNKALDEMGATAAKAIGDMKKSGEEATEEISGMKTSHELFVKSLAEEHSGEIKEAMESQLKLMEFEKTAILELAAAEKERAKAKIQEAMATGTMGAEEGMLRLAKIEEAAKKFTTGMVSSERVAKINIMTQALDAMIEKEIDLTEASERAERATEDHKRKQLIKDLPKRAAELDEQVKMEKELADKAEERVAKERAALGRAESFGTTENILAARERLGAAEGDLATHRGLQHVMEANAKRVRDAYNQLVHDQTVAADEAVQLAGKLREMTEEIRAQQRAIEDLKKTHAAVSVTERAVGRIGGEIAGSTLRRELGGTPLGEVMTGARVEQAGELARAHLLKVGGDRGKITQAEREAIAGEDRLTPETKALIAYVGHLLDKNVHTVKAAADAVVAGTQSQDQIFKLISSLVDKHKEVVVKFKDLDAQIQGMSIP